LLGRQKAEEELVHQMRSLNRDLVEGEGEPVDRQTKEEVEVVEEARRMMASAGEVVRLIEVREVAEVRWNVAVVVEEVHLIEAKAEEAERCPSLAVVEQAEKKVGVMEGHLKMVLQGFWEVMVEGKRQLEEPHGRGMVATMYLMHEVEEVGQVLVLVFWEAVQ
jgi:hypothetical protein